ncbi:MAG: TetR/AcrR family transcriptional regulator [Anaerolineaceae bacterium]
MSEKSLDPRPEQTKEKIKQAFIRLTRERPFHAITVKDICKYARVNRSTFYAHFKDIYQLLNDVVEEGETISETPVSRDDIYVNPEAYIDRYQKSFEFSKQNKDLRMILMTQFIDSPYFHDYIQKFIEQGLAIQHAVQPEDSVKKVPDKLLAFYCLGGISQLVYLWIKEDLPYTSREMAVYAAKITILLNAIMTGVDPDTLPISKVEGWENPSKY